MFSSFQLTESYMYTAFFGKVNSNFQLLVKWLLVNTQGLVKHNIIHFCLSMDML